MDQSDAAARAVDEAIARPRLLPPAPAATPAAIETFEAALRALTEATDGSSTVIENADTLAALGLLTLHYMGDKQDWPALKDATGQICAALGGVFVADPRDLGFRDSGGDIDEEATLGETTLTSKLIDGTYPDYQRVIPDGNDKVATLEHEAFKQAIDRVATISSERGRAVKLSLSKASLALSVTDPDSGEAREEIEPDYDGDPIEIGFNARYLLDALGVLGGDTIQMKLAEPGAPAVFQRREGDPLLVVLMPMRV